MANKQEPNSLDNMSADVEGQDDPSSRSGERLFEIHVKGHLNHEWSDWLGGLEIKLMDNGEMILVGPIVDQAALMGVLNKLSRLNLTIRSVNEVKKKDE